MDGKCILTLQTRYSVIVCNRCWPLSWDLLGIAGVIWRRRPGHDETAASCQVFSRNWRSLETKCTGSCFNQLEIPKMSKAHVEDVLQISFGVQGNPRKEEQEAYPLLLKWEIKRNSTWTRPKSALQPLGFMLLVCILLVLTSDYPTSIMNFIMFSSGARK